MRRSTLTIFLGLALLVVLAFATSAHAQAPDPRVIALSDEDAETCKAGGCYQLTEAAFQATLARMRQVERLEQIAEGLAAELKKKPTRTYCM